MLAGFLSGLLGILRLGGDIGRRGKLRFGEDGVLLPPPAPLAELRVGPVPTEPLVPPPVEVQLLADLDDGAQADGEAVCVQSPQQLLVRFRSVGPTSQ